MPLFKMYVSYVSDDYVTSQYGTYAQTVLLEGLELHPKKEGEGIGDVFFKMSRNFSYHYRHEDFIIIPTAPQCSLAKFLNYATDNVPADRMIKQNLFLRQF